MARGLTGTTSETLYNPGFTAVPNIRGTYTTGSSFVITLDEAVDKSTLSSSTVKLKDLTTGKSLSVEGTVTGAANEIVVGIIGVNDYLIPRNSYELVLDGVKAANGNVVEPFALGFSYNIDQPMLNDSSFTVGDTGTAISGQNISPLVEGSLLGNKTTFAPGAKIDVNFGAASAKLDTKTVNTTNFKLIDVKTDKEVAINVNYVDGVNKVVITPKASLEDNGEYRVVVSKNVKDVNGLGLRVIGGQEEIKSPAFNTLDVTPPTVKAVTTIDGDLNNVEIGEPTTFKVEFSEALTAAPARSNATTYAAFLNGSANGNMLIQRADTGAVVNLDDEDTGVKTTINANADGKSYNVSLLTNVEDLRGVALKITFAGYNPQRYTNIANNTLIRDRATTANAMENDYEVYFTVEGEDTVAPKFTGAKTTLASGETAKVELKNATNVNSLVYVMLDDKLANIDQATGKVELLQNGSVVKTLTKGTVGTADQFDYQTVEGKAAIVFDQSKVSGSITGAVQLRVSEIKDNSTNANESTTYRVDYIAGKGATVDKVTFVDKDALSGTPADASKAAIKIEFDGAMDRTSLTNATVKLLDGETVVSSSLDFKDFTSSTNKTVYLVADSALSAGKTYKVVVTKDAKDANGNAVQPDATKAPKDYTVNVTTTTSGDIEVVENGVYNEAARTVTFNFTQNVDSTNLVIKNKATGDTVASPLTSTANVDSGDAKKVVVTLNDAFTKNTEYEVSLTANNTATSSSAVATSTFVPTKNLKADITLGTPKVDVGIVDLTGKTVLQFTENVKGSDVKAAVKVYDATNNKDVKLFDSSFVYSATNGYASTFTVTIPGYKSTNDYYLTIAKETIADEAGFKNDKAVDVRLSDGGGTVDLTAPVITINQADQDVKISDVGTLTAPTATATDNVDGSVSATISKVESTISGTNLTETDFNTAKGKTYTAGDKIVVTFTATDAAGNTATETVTYTVIDN